MSACLSVASFFCIFLKLLITPIQCLPYAGFLYFEIVDKKLEFIKPTNNHHQPMVVGGCVMCAPAYWCVGVVCVLPLIKEWVSVLPQNRELCCLFLKSG